MACVRISVDVLWSPSKPLPGCLPPSVWDRISLWPGTSPQHLDQRVTKLPGICPCLPLCHYWKWREYPDLCVGSEHWIQVCTPVRQVLYDEASRSAPRTLSEPPCSVPNSSVAHIAPYPPFATTLPQSTSLTHWPFSSHPTFRDAHCVLGSFYISCAISSFLASFPTLDYEYHEIQLTEALSMGTEHVAS